MKIAIIGGGASGLFCAGLINAHHSVDLYEKNSSLGKKLLVTGNGRCNVTNLKTPNDFLNHVVTNAKFLYSALHSFTPQDMHDLLTSSGIDLLQEADNKVFPTSGKAKTILTFLQNKLGDNVTVKLNSSVQSVMQNSNGFLVYVNNQEHFYDSVIIATGGLSYPLLGSSGDGYSFASNLGHDINACRQSLCGLKVKDPLIAPNQGVSFEAALTITNSTNKTMACDAGSVMITNFGFSGPAVFKLVAKFNELSINDHKLVIDFAPNQTEQDLQEYLDTYTKNNPKSEVFEAVSSYYVKRFAANLKQEYYSLLTTPCNQLSKDKKAQVKKLVKSLSFAIDNFDSYDRAIVTKGGVNVKQVNPKTMESKLVRNLFFLGEVLDVDALTGGYNLQIAFSTAHACAGYINSLN